jgi:thiosulfate/3-mercaptopyruvate sulfurtransferase
VIYEGSMASGFGQSCRGYFLLKFLGYPKAMVLHGGFQAWATAGLPISAETPSVTPKDFPVSDEGMAMMIDRETMLQAVGDDGIAKLDVRDVDEWLGTSSSPYGPDFCPRKGRIPGAKWIEWYRLMKPTPTGPMFKSKDEVLAECHSVGITPETPVYLYCFKGRHQGRAHVFRLLERMEPRPQPAGRRRPALGAGVRLIAEPNPSPALRERVPSKARRVRGVAVEDYMEQTR